MMTALGGDNDPRSEAAADVWLSLISTLLGISPKLAASAGRTWYAALVEAAFDTDDPIHHRALRRPDRDPREAAERGRAHGAPDRRRGQPPGGGFRKRG
ncbi:MAG: hypothetical protein JST00_00910 [Deltaproteobacteria bacterium]|nr:hypothetical protein [Deltaproteobacteria bacterium]